jgi:hypothetical protein
MPLKVVYLPMAIYNSQLPQDKKLDIPALSRIFQSTSTSYKFLFFMAILSQLESRHWKEGEPVCLTLEDLAAEMALLSWYPVKFYRLSFGWQDQVSKIISKLDFDPSFKAITSKQGQDQLRTAIKDQAKDIGLYSILKFVPYRLQSVFFSNELKGITEKSKNNEIAELANQYNSATIPLYHYVQKDNLSAIQIDNEWVKYLLHDSNITIVKDWVLWEWVCYLQKRNPNTPAIINKVLPPIKRSSLNNQTNFWKKVIQADSDIRCIYSGKPLADQSFSLDHFLPWTFICHDQIWNLCPVTQASNSSKGNKLPADNYVDAFIQQHIKALQVSSTIMPAKAWDKLTESYAIDLHLDPELLLDEKAVTQAYNGILKPMIALAEQTGFESSWSYQLN